MLCGALAVQEWLPVPIRAIAALPLVLLLPGLAVTQAIGYPPTMWSWERLVWTLGTSISITVLGGLVLHLVGLPFTPVAWAALLSIVTVSAMCWAMWRSRTTEPASTDRPVVPREGGGLFLIAGLIILIAVTYVQLDAAEAARPTASQLWIVPSDASSIRLGVRSHEPGPTDFRLTVEGTQGEPLEWLLRLAPAETFEIVVLVEGDDGPVRARLFSPDDGAPLREVVFWPVPGPT